MPECKMWIDAVLLQTDEELSVEDIEIRIVEEFGEWLEKNQIYRVLEGREYYRSIEYRPYRYQLLR